jgi:signal transduction histidine kinase
MAAFPLISADRVIGVLNVYAEAEGYFDAERAAEIQALANLTAIALSEAAGREQVRRRAADLEVAVDRRTAELRAAVDELETFAYSVSHDLRAPLRAITGFAEIVVRRYSGDLHPEAGRYLDHVLRASEHMGRLIDDLLQYARLGRGGIELQAIEVSDVVSLALGDVGPMIRRTGGVVRSAVGSCRVRANGTLLRRIVTNLVENALTYARPGVPPEVDITCEHSDGGVYVGVRDNGIGIRAEHHASIFNLFQRLHTQEEIPGTGIGLAVVRRSAQLLGGRVGVESEPGRGSRFWVFLPAAAVVVGVDANGGVNGAGSSVQNHS